MSQNESLQLGAGLIGIGREWGHVKTSIPTEQEVLAYLQTAYSLGIRFFDTAPSYGSSEERLGKFLGTLSQGQRRGIIVSTKFGEHWDEAKQEPYTDHSYEALTRSIDQSIQRLGIPDVLMLHKSSPQVLQSADLAQAIAYAKQKGIKSFGVSVSDLESARMVVENSLYSYIQLPYNTAKTDFADIIDASHTKAKTVVVNRPFNMGAIVHDTSQSREVQVVEAYRFVAQKLRRGDIVLTGTKFPIHLQENVTAWRQATRKR